MYAAMFWMLVATMLAQSCACYWAARVIRRLKNRIEIQQEIIGGLTRELALSAASEGAARAAQNS